MPRPAAQGSWRHVPMGVFVPSHSSFVPNDTRSLDRELDREMHRRWP